MKSLEQRVRDAADPTKRTSGVWAARFNDPLASASVVVRASDGRAFEALVAGADYAERKANAALMAAGPALFDENVKLAAVVEAAKKALEVLGRLAVTGGDVTEAIELRGMAATLPAPPFRVSRVDIQAAQDDLVRALAIAGVR